MAQLNQLIQGKHGERRFVTRERDRPPEEAEPHVQGGPDPHPPDDGHVAEAPPVQRFPFFDGHLTPARLWRESVGGNTRGVR